MSLILLKEKNFRRYFAADFISHFGNGLHLIAMGWFVFKATGSNESVGLIWMTSLISGLFMLPVAGPIVDRYDRLKILIYSNTVRCILTASIAATFYTDFFRIELIYLLAFFNGLGWNLYVPASSALIQEILDRENYMQGNSFIELTKQTGLLTSAGIAGYLYNWAGFSIILFIDAATFIVSNLYLIRVGKPEFVPNDIHDRFLKRLKNGWNYLTSNQTIFIFGLISFIPFIAMLSGNVVAPGYVSDHLHEGPDVYGTMEMVAGIGALIGGLAAGFFASKIGRSLSLFLLLIMAATSSFLLYFNTTPLGAYILLFFFAFGIVAARVLFNTTLMEFIPRSFMGRATSVFMLIANFGQIASAWYVGRLMDDTSVRVGMIYLGALFLLAFILLLINYPFLKRRDGGGRVLKRGSGYSADLRRTP